MTATAHLIIPRGAPFSVEFPVYSDEEQTQLVDLTDWSAFAQVRERRFVDSTLLFEWSSETAEGERTAKLGSLFLTDEGYVKLWVDAAQSLQWGWVWGWWQLALRAPGADEPTLPLTGSVFVDREVARRG